MTINLWGIQGAFSLGLPTRPAGYALLVICLVGLALILIDARAFPVRDFKLRPKSPSARAAEMEWLLVLLLVAPIAAETLLVHLPLHAAGAALGLPKELEGPALGVLSAVPWMLAAGYLGVWQAVLVGLAAGLARGGWETQSLTTVFMMGLAAGIAAWLLRQNFRERIARLARQPVVAGVIAGSAFGLLRVVEIYASSPGGVYDGLDFALSQSGPVMLASIIEAGIGGVVGQVLVTTNTGGWHKPVHLQAGPYNRSLASRMLSALAAMGIVGIVVLGSGQWYLARSSARDLVESQMQQTAVQAGEGIPFFVQAGRETIRRLAQQALPLVQADPADPSLLAEAEANQNMFQRLAVFDTQGALVTLSPESAALAQPLPLAFEAGLKIGLQGVPQEVVVPPDDRSQAVQLVFLAPIVDPTAGKTMGVAAGWTSLADNQLLAPALGLLEQSALGETYVVDDRGRILFHPQGQDVLDVMPLPGSATAGVETITAPDGTRELEYVYPVEGYPWRVVVTVPQRVVDRMAVPTATRLLGVVTLVGLALLAFVYWTSRRVTLPVRHMASTAEAIARGDLERTVPPGGEDEVGRLATSFERMRRSLKARLEAMDLLLAVSQTLASGIELPSSLTPILEGLVDLTGAEVARLALAPDESFHQSTTGLQAAGDSGRWEALDAQILGLCQERGHFVLENPARARAVLDVDHVGDDVEALMAFPIQNEDQYLGALWLAHGKRHLISPDEVNLITIISAQIGVWLANVGLFHRVAEERQRLATVLEATPDAVIVIDRLGRILLANPAAEIVLNGSAEQALGQPAETWVAVPEILALLTSGEGESRVIEVQLDGGRVLSAATKEIEVGGRASSGRVCVLWDITHYKKLDMLKSEFVSTVSHDLRAPLTLMRGYSTMLAMVGSLNAQQQEFVGKILDSVGQMGDLVENLLDLGRIEAGLGLNLEVFAFEDVLDEILNAQRPQAINKRISLEAEVAGALEPIEADPTMLRQAVSNLIDNAIKYTQAGGQILVRVSQAHGRMSIAIRDTGMGISPADQSRLFERFYRARRQESLKERGTGLGLAIVKSIVEQHGGTVTVESRLGAGSTFTVDLPMQAPLQVENTLEN
jgi:PAS domain S-box-containing protein